MFFVESLPGAAAAAHARVSGRVTEGQLLELLQMLEAIGIVKEGGQSAVPAPVVPPPPPSPAPQAAAPAHEAPGQ